jgi:hypothetical protein
MLAYSLYLTGSFPAPAQSGCDFALIDTFKCLGVTDTGDKVPARWFALREAFACLWSAKPRREDPGVSPRLRRTSRVMS